MPERMGERSNFLATCNLLSQYIKQKGSLGELMIAPPRLVEPKGAFRPPTTMSLLPGVGVSGDDNTETKNAANSMDLFPQQAGCGLLAVDDSGKLSEKAPLTIFYGGRVIVFDNFPAEKAKDLMEMAGKGSSVAKGFDLSSTPSASPVTGAAPDCPPKPAKPASADLPLQRRASLSRFLEKRKDRITSKAPYQVTTSSLAPVKSEATELCLGLGLQTLKPVLSSESRR